LFQVSGVGFSWNINCACSTKTTTIKAPKASGQWQVKAQKQGQPTHATHPHLMQEGEVLHLTFFHIIMAVYLLW
jgi:hypothetical protein